MENLLDSQLKKEFPSDVSESIMIDILRNVKGDKEKAKKIAQGLNKNISDEKSREYASKMKELEITFNDLDKLIIKQVLEENNWIVDNCLVPLFELQQKHQQKKT